MSASLVGSEMCIRDSPMGALIQSWAAACNMVADAARRESRERLGQRGGAVSYTHLTLPTICSV
eukprot:11746701-Alexandrium_andersonii.AAC.1